MVLISCPECQRRTSSHAKACPACGYPIAEDPAKSPGAAEGLDYEVYVRERELLSSLEVKNWDGYDRAILTLSAAFLAFSLSLIGLLKQILPEGIRVQHFVQMEYAWICFGASILLILISFPIDAEASRSAVEHLELALEDGNTDRKNPLATIGQIASLLAGGLFMVGLILLLIFSAANLKGGVG